jgi:hypothetical protein
MLFQDLGSRKIVADLQGGNVSSDGGLLLLRQVNSGLGISRLFAQCFTLLAAAIGKEDVLGEERCCAKDIGFACASPATLNRLELDANFSDRYRKVHADPVAVEDALLKLGVRCLPSNSEVLILDFDATDDPLHGNQEERFFHGYYGNYCYLPLSCFCGSVPLWAQLRRGNADASREPWRLYKKSLPLFASFCRSLLIPTRPQ